MPKRLRALLIAPLLLAPVAASARDVAGCANLYRQLNNAPVVIGNSVDIRRYTMDLTQQYNQIRQLRIELRRANCAGGGGSVVVYGRQNNAICQDIQQELDSMERVHEALKAERDDARKEMMKPSQERLTIMAAIRQNDCTPADVEEEKKERMKVPGLALPKDDPSSSITNFGKPIALPTQASAAKPPPPPDRPYDPTKKVRMVGPVFLPEASIDLAHPKSSGPQQQQ